MPVFRECANVEMCRDFGYRETENKTELNGLNCEGCHTYNIYKKGFEDGVQALASQLNSEIEKSKSKIIPDYRDGWKLKEGGQ